jgi:hypothetical protein
MKKFWVGIKQAAEDASQVAEIDSPRLYPYKAN